MQTKDAAKAARIQKRIFEIDALRGVAILMMSTFHLLFDLTTYFGVNVNIQSGPGFWVGRLSAILFMLVSGVSSSLGGRQVRRGFMVLGCGLIVTLASIPIMGEYYIRFGILHFFGAAMVLKGLYEMAVKNRTARLVTAALLVPLCFWLGGVVGTLSVKGPFLLPLGITYPGFVSFDYYPLLPWAGYFCLGIVAGMLVYKNKRSLLRWSPYTEQENTAGKAGAAVLRPLCFLGRHSLLVYLLHQPLILAVLFLLSFAGVL